VCGVRATVSAIDSASLLAGPAVAGVLVTFTAPAVAFGLNTTSFLVSALVVASIRLRPARGPATAAASADGAAQTGAAHHRSVWRALLTDAQLRAVTASMVGVNIVVGMSTVASSSSPYRSSAPVPREPATCSPRTAAAGWSARSRPAGCSDDPGPVARR
jgi:hypothetical protein